MEVVVETTGAIRRAELQSNRHHQQTNTQLITDLTKYGHSRSNHTSIINADPPEEFHPLCPAFQGHSRSSELTRIDQLSTTSY